MGSVCVMQRTGRKFWECQWRDPASRLKVTCSTKTTDRDKALRFAGVIEAQIAAGISFRPIGWKVFRKKYVDLVVKPLRDATHKKVATVFDAVEALANPRQPSDLTAAKLTEWQGELRKRGNEESTIRTHLDYVLAALEWGRTQGYVARVPDVIKPGKGGMKGRAIAREEFERIRAKVPALVARPRPGELEDYCELLDGLWLSGLRLEESLVLSWDDPSLIRVDLSGPFPMFDIPAEHDKGRKERFLPIAPEFAEWLLATPPEERTGYVFFRRCQGKRCRPTLNWASKRLSKLGELANVKVGQSGRRIKFASAHDFRRAFGVRWSRRVQAAVLRDMMRHESIATTMTYYVGRESEALAASIWEAFAVANTPANSAHFGRHPAQRFDAAIPAYFEHPGARRQSSVTALASQQASK